MSERLNLLVNKDLDSGASGKPVYSKTPAANTSSKPDSPNTVRNLIDQSDGSSAGEAPPVFTQTELVPLVLVASHQASMSRLHVCWFLLSFSQQRCKPTAFQLWELWDSDCHECKI